MQQLVIEITAGCNVTKSKQYSQLLFKQPIMVVIHLDFVYNQYVWSISTVWYIYLLRFIHWLLREKKKQERED